MVVKVPRSRWRFQAADPALTTAGRSGGRGHGDRAQLHGGAAEGHALLEQKGSSFSFARARPWSPARHGGRLVSRTEETTTEQAAQRAAGAVLAGATVSRSSRPRPSTVVPGPDPAAQRDRGHDP
ncbi:hypothetical protein QJS66_03915 [Kocuria rhizophila]|nr:hypothetical protein QJS66_03915 [Kocuria rhizophila]